MQNSEDNQNIKETEIKDISNVHDVVQIMAHMINYLSVSLYESEFTKNHQDSYATLKSIYDSVALTPSIKPPINDISQFYDNIVYLGKVTFTDDPDYYKYKIGLKKYIVELQYRNKNE